MDAIFVIAQSISPKKFLQRDVELDSLVVFYTPELNLFHFRIDPYVNITRVRVKRKGASVLFDTRTQFNRKGKLEGRLDFKIESGNWQFVNLVLKNSSNQGEVMPAWK